MRVGNTVQNFYQNVFNRRSNPFSGTQAFKPITSAEEPCKLVAEKVDTPLDIQAEGLKAATESIGARSRMSVFTSELENIFGVGLDGEKEINMDSLGENKLTDDQIKDLQDRYDVENLSSQEKYNLMSELSQLGVISGTDAVNSALSMVAMPVVNGVPMMVRKGNGILNNSKNFMSNLQNTALQEMESYEYMKEHFKKSFDDLKNISDSHKRLLEVLTQLKQEK